MSVVLVVEGNDSALSESLSRELTRKQYDTRTAVGGGRVLSEHRDADLILLDLDLPDMDGLEVCRAIRANAQTPIIAFTAQDDEVERILALHAGADDCVLSSCGAREIMARVEAVMRRVYSRVRDETIWRAPLRIDRRTREVRLDDRLVNVTGKEFDLLCTLASRDSVVSRRELMTTVWGIDDSSRSRTLDTHVSSLRNKLGSSEWILTVWGIGYRMGRGAGAQ